MQRLLMKFQIRLLASAKQSLLKMKRRQMKPLLRELLNSKEYLLFMMIMCRYDKKGSCDPNEMMILGRPFLATIHARIDVFDNEISLGVGEDKIVFDMNGNVHHSVVLVENACMINEFQGEE
ncbi:hypothetical protein Tco_0293989 [Tanacetum coccineum]